MHLLKNWQIFKSATKMAKKTTVDKTKSSGHIAKRRELPAYARLILGWEDKFLLTPEVVCISIMEMLLYSKGNMGSDTWVFICYRAYVRSFYFVLKLQGKEGIFTTSRLIQQASTPSESTKRIHEAPPETKKGWPKWGKRTELNCLMTCI